MAFIEQRDATDRYLIARWHLKANDAVISIFDKSNITAIIEATKNITVHNGDATLPDGVRIERKEILTYNDVIAVDGTIYSATLLKIFEIPAKSETIYYIVGNGQETIGVGTLEKIDWENNIIISKNIVSLATGDQTDVSIPYRAWRDFRGNVIQQYFLDRNGNPTLGIYVYDFTAYGIGQRSVVVAKTVDGIWHALEIAQFVNEKSLNMTDLYGNAYKENGFFFEVSKLNGPAIEISTRTIFSPTTKFSLQRLWTTAASSISRSGIG